MFISVKKALELSRDFLTCPKQGGVTWQLFFQFVGCAKQQFQDKRFVHSQFQQCEGSTTLDFHQHVANANRQTAVLQVVGRLLETTFPENELSNFPQQTERRKVAALIDVQ